MTMTDITPAERLEEALTAWDAAETAVQTKGAAAGPDDDKAIADAFAEVQRAHAAFDRSDQGKKFRQALTAGKTPDDSQALDDGRTFDDLASASGVVNPTPGMSLGEAFAKSDAYQELVEQHTNGAGEVVSKLGRSRSVDLAVSFTALLNAQSRYKFDGEGPKNALVTGASDTSGGALVQEDRVAGVSDLVPLRQPSILELCTRQEMTTDTLEFVQINAKTNNAAEVAEATSAAGLTSAGAVGGVTDVVGGLKPESAMTLAEVQQAVQTIAHWVPYTRRVAADAPQMVTLLNAFLFAGLAARADSQALNGDGAAPNWRGLVNSTNPWNIQTFDLSVNGDPSRLDAVALAAAQIYNTGEGEWAPNAMLVHPLDWFSTDFVLAKDSQGQYHGPGPWAAIGNQAPWGIRPIITKSIAQGVQVVGDFTQMLFGDRMQNTLLFTDSHSDFFLRNILVALAEMRGCVGVRVPQAFVQNVA